MGYYNPLLSYGEERLLHDAKEARVNGFIGVDVPTGRGCEIYEFLYEWRVCDPMKISNGPC